MMGGRRIEGARFRWTTRPPRRWLAAIVLLSVLPAAATASPPPPPPASVVAARDLLTDAANKDANRIANLFAANVTASLNGRPIASGKLAWLRWWAEDRRHYYGRTLGSSMGWRENGALLVLDQFDTQDYSARPPPPGDPRPTTRSTVYRFGTDGLIHAVEIAEINSFFMPASRGSS